MPITFKRAGQEAVTLENVSFRGVVLDKVTFKRAGQEAVTVFERMSQLATPQNVTADGTTVSWDAVENATSYAVLADGSEIGTVERSVTDELDGTWLFNDSLSISDDITWNVNYTTNSEDYTDLRISLQSGPIGHEPCMGTSEYPTLFYNMGSWDDKYKTIIITSKLSEVTNGDTLLAWLQENATKQ